MSIDAEDVMKRAECPSCGECCEDFAPGVSSVTFGGLMYHPECVPLSEGYPVSLSAGYAREVRDLLTSGSTATRSAAEHPLLSGAEAEELLKDYVMGVSAKAFAAKLEARDIAVFEQSIDKEVPSPVTS